MSLNQTSHDLLDVVHALLHLAPVGLYDGQTFGVQLQALATARPPAQPLLAGRTFARGHALLERPELLGERVDIPGQLRVAIWMCAVSWGVPGLRALELVEPAVDGLQRPGLHVDGVVDQARQRVALLLVLLRPRLGGGCQVHVRGTEHVLEAVDATPLLARRAALAQGQGLNVLLQLADVADQGRHLPQDQAYLGPVEFHLLLLERLKFLHHAHGTGVGVRYMGQHHARRTPG
mmetsp:Transcript_117954/g.334486  ORF Transcript_117954/g.334486 Transcript_117954/m.334486 type:complete len:234 (+) Transcript_117954:753-1454(+)